jgi:hypothetical protein
MPPHWRKDRRRALANGMLADRLACLAKQGRNGRGLPLWVALPRAAGRPVRAATSADGPRATAGSCARGTAGTAL